MSSNLINGIVPSPNKRRKIYTNHHDEILHKSDITPSAKVCRQLLPVNHAEVAATLDDEFRKHIEEKSKQWNFDFEKDQPLDNNKDNGFQWIECQETGNENGQGSGTSWVAPLQDNVEDDDVFTNVTENHEKANDENPEIKPRRRLFGTSENVTKTFSPIVHPQIAGKHQEKAPPMTCTKVDNNGDYNCRRKKKST